MSQERTAPGSIAERLKSLRSASGRSLEGLARELGVHFTTVSAWERGRSRPNYRTLSKLASLYQVSPEYLLEEFALEGAPGRLVPGPSPARFQRIPDRTREELIGGLEEVRFLVMVREVMDGRSIRAPQLVEATGIGPTRLEALLEGGARPTVSEILHLADALGIRMEDRADAEPPTEEAQPGGEPEDLLAALQEIPAPVRARVVRLLQGTVALALGRPAPRRGGS